jgi:hypothetical protein
MRKSIAAALLLIFASGAAGAYDPIVLERGWQRVDRFDDGQCFGEVGTNGQFYVLSVAGLAPGENARLILTNGDMPPIDRVVRADAVGRWQEYYIPFRPNRGEGGLVTASIEGERCAVPLSFAWQRMKGWEERAPLPGGRGR